MEENKKKFLQNTWFNIILGILLVVAGIIVIVISINNPENISQFIAIVMACALFLMGAIALGMSLVLYHGVKIHAAVIYGSALIGAGVVLILLRNEIIVQIVNFVAVFLISFGAAELVNAIIMTAQKKLNNIKPIWIVLFYLLAAATIALGTVVLVFNLNNTADFQKVLYVIVGVCIIVSGLLEVVAECLKVRAKHKEEDKTIDNKPNEPAPEAKPAEEAKPVEEAPQSTPAPEATPAEEDKAE